MIAIGQNRRTSMYRLAGTADQARLAGGHSVSHMSTHCVWSPLTARLCSTGCRWKRSKVRITSDNSMEVAIRFAVRLIDVDDLVVMADSKQG